LTIARREERDVKRYIKSGKRMVEEKKEEEEEGRESWK
jgi:hypothetical protein